MKDRLGHFQFVQLYRGVGPKRFWFLIIGLTVAISCFAAVGIWLESQVGWPERYGFHCHRKCLIEDLWHSPALLRDGGGYELGLFAFFWSMPAFVVGCLSFALLRRRRRNPILPLDSQE